MPFTFCHSLNMPSISDQLLEHVNYLTQSLYHQQSHRHVKSSISTNSELIELLKLQQLNSNHVHLLTADSQRAGRGQHGRSWQSPKGNVYLSLYYPSKHRHHPLVKPISGLLSLCIGYFLTKLPIITAINQHRQQHNQSIIGVKWANDIGFYQNASLQENPQLNNQSNSQINNHNQRQLFQKLSGILIEPVMDGGRMLGVVVGVGLNVHTAPFLTQQTQEGMSYQSVSLADLVDKNIKHITIPKVQELYQPISKAIFQALLTHQSIVADDTQLQIFLENFAKSDILRHRLLHITQTTPLKNKPFTQDQKLIGRATGIDKFGCLQVQTSDGQISKLFTGKIDAID